MTPPLSAAPAIRWPISPCRGREPEAVLETAADLATRFQVATVLAGVRVIDFGTAEARSLLLSGWSADKKHANDLGFGTEDPAELEDLADRYPIRAFSMRALLDERLASTGRRLEAEEAVLDPEVEQRLKALGYLQGRTVLRSWGPEARRVGDCALSSQGRRRLGRPLT